MLGNEKLLFDELYEKTKDCGRVQFVKLLMTKEEENQELKKQLEELEKENFNLRENIYINKISFSSEGRNIKELFEMPTYEDLINQQKEFIEYLEDLIKQNETVVEVSKYKEIIGDIKSENK